MEDVSVGMGLSHVLMRRNAPNDCESPAQQFSFGVLMRHNAPTSPISCMREFDSADLGEYPSAG